MVLKTPVPNDAFHFYIVPPGTTLYRGFPRVRGRNPVLDDFHFVTTDKKTASKYGVPFPLVTDREYKLVALDHTETLNLLYAQAPSGIQCILDENYGRGTMRNSVFDNDVKFSKHLCTLGHDGYATRKMDTREKTQPDFHEELMFCDTSHLQIGETDLTDAQIEQVVLRMREKEHARQLKKSRKRKTSKSPPKLFTTSQAGFKTPGGGGRRKTRRNY